MKVIDDGEDLLSGPGEEQAANSMPVLSFGTGHGENLAGQRVEKGSGMYAGQATEVRWGIMCSNIDDVMFAELDSLARVG